MRVGLDLAGVNETQRRLSIRASRLANMAPAFEDVADGFLALEEQAFRTGGRALGAKWPPLSPRWARWKAENRPGAGLLEMRAGGGPLRRALTRRGATHQILDLGPTSARMGTSLGIAWVHHKGATVQVRSGSSGKAHRATIPKRALVRVQRPTRQRWVTTLDAYASGERPRSRLVL